MKSEKYLWERSLTRGALMVWYPMTEAIDYVVVWCHKWISKIKRLLKNTLEALLRSMMKFYDIHRISYSRLDDSWSPIFLPVIFLFQINWNIEIAIQHIWGFHSDCLIYCLIAPFATDWDEPYWYGINPQKMFILVVGICHWVGAYAVENESIIFTRWHSLHSTIYIADSTTGLLVSVQIDRKSASNSRREWENHFEKFTLIQFVKINHR